MAVSERGGKNNSGDYEYLLDDDGNLKKMLLETEIDQDLVNHDITRDDLLTPDFDFEKADLNIVAFVKFLKNKVLILEKLREPMAVWNTVNLRY